MYYWLLWPSCCCYLYFDALKVFLFLFRYANIQTPLPLFALWFLIYVYLYASVLCWQRFIVSLSLMPVCLVLGNNCPKSIRTLPYPSFVARSTGAFFSSAIVFLYMKRILLILSIYFYLHACWLISVEATAYCILCYLFLYRIYSQSCPCE